MIAIFLAAFVAGLMATAILLFTLSEDLAAKSIRPMFLLVIAVSAWFVTYPALTALEPASILVYPAYNVVAGSSIIQVPAYNITTTQPRAVLPGTANIYLYFWIFMLLVHVALGVLYLYELGAWNIKEAFKLINGKKSADEQ